MERWSYTECSISPILQYSNPFRAAVRIGSFLDKVPGKNLKLRNELVVGLAISTDRNSKAVDMLHQWRGVYEERIFLRKVPNVLNKVPRTHIPKSGMTRRVLGGGIVSRKDALQNGQRASKVRKGILDFLNLELMKSGKMRILSLWPAMW